MKNKHNLTNISPKIGHTFRSDLEALITFEVVTGMRKPTHGRIALGHEPIVHCTAPTGSRLCTPKYVLICIYLNGFISILQMSHRTKHLA